MVLLKNDGTLPFSGAEQRKLALYGSGARSTIKGGTGSGDVNVRHFVNIEEGLEHAGFTITTKAWMDAYDAICQRAKKEYYAGVRKEAEAAGVKGQAIMLFAMGPRPASRLQGAPLDGEGGTAVYNGVWWRGNRPEATGRRCRADKDGDPGYPCFESEV